MKNTACAKILVVSFSILSSLLLLLLLSPKWIGFVLGAIFVYTDDENMCNVELQCNSGDCG